MPKVEPMKACELLPCPFTGRSPSEPIQQGNGQWRIWAGDYYLQRPTRELVIAAWNRRAHPTGEVGDIVERLRKPMDCEETLQAWDKWRRWIKEGRGSLPRDNFENTLSCLDEERAEAADLIQSLQSRLSISDENVERVARAICLTNPWTEDDWKQFPDEVREHWRVYARACLASLGGVG
jgi:hypothetical protein